MSALLARLPLQLVCQLIVTETPGINYTKFALDQLMPSQVLPDGYIAYPDVGAAYKIYNETVGWKVARKRCIAEGAHLALVDSVKKLEYITNRTAFPGQRIHVGIHKLFGDDDWVSSKDGIPVTSPPWASGEPYGEYSCVMFKLNINGLSNDGCEIKGNYACELPIPRS